MSRHGTSPGAGAVGVSCLLLIFSYFYRIQPGRNAAYTEDQSGEGRTLASPGRNAPKGTQSPTAYSVTALRGRSQARAREPTQGHRKPGKLTRVDRDTSPGRNAQKGTQSPRASPGR